MLFRSGRIVDVTGQYVLGWYLAAGMGLLAVPLVLLAAPPDDLAGRYREAAEHEDAGSGVAPLVRAPAVETITARSAPMSAVPATEPARILFFTRPPVV